MKKTSITIAFLLFIVIMLSACSFDSANKNSGKFVAGGVSAPAENINLKDINIIEENGQTAITLSLLSGSRKAGYAETKLTQLPTYTLTMLDQPQRLMIRFDGVSFWDYEEKTTWAFPDYIAGVFREVPADNDSLIFYIQLTKNATFDVEESEGDLIVRLTPGAENFGTPYYCVSNAFFEHQEGTWPDSVEMSPVLCADKQNKILISQPFGTQEEALGYVENTKDLIASVLPDKSLSVIQLAAGALPDYSTDIDYTAAEGRGVLLNDGVLLNTPVLLQNGRYLAASNDGRIAFSRKYQPGEPALEQDSYLMSEKLWILDPNGRIQSIDTPEFFSIDRAAFSFDGRYLALIDVSIENRVLYVYDFEKLILYNLGEEGFGSQTTSFAWSDSLDTLYAMTGFNTMQLMSCVFLQEGSIQVGAVEEEPGAEGNLAVSNARIYFADNVAGQVYEIGETWRKLTSGIDIKISPDGASMLVLEVMPSNDEQVLTSMKLYDIESGGEKVIPVDTEIIDFRFDKSGNIVYYTGTLNTVTVEGYDYGLYSYDVASGAQEQVGLCSAPDFESANGKLYFIDYIDEGGNSFYATYVYDPNEK